MNIKRSQADILFSKWQRSLRNGKCERCYKIVGFEKLQVSHFHGRRKQSVRFDQENISVICFACHRFFTENPFEHTAWFKERLGEKRFKALLVRANTPAKQDEKLLILAFKEEIKRQG